MKSSSAAAAAALFFAFPSNSLGYTWNFKSTPTQCGQLTIAISGQGSPPYSVLILPSGQTSFQNGTEVRKIIEANSTADSSEITFQLKYPANSQFVAVVSGHSLGLTWYFGAMGWMDGKVLEKRQGWGEIEEEGVVFRASGRVPRMTSVSDSTGFGSGGTSAAAQVTDSNDSSCYDASTSVVPQWVFNTEPQSQIVQCQPTRLWWDPSKVQGKVSFLGVIPGGNSFKIPEGQITDKSSSGLGTGFDWTPNIRAGTTLHIVGSDGRGTGNGGSTRPNVGDNINRDNSCLNDQSPSSTAGNPAGGSYPTDSSGNGVSESGGGNKTNVGAIVGGVVGGVFALIALALVLWFFRKRSQDRRRPHEKPVDLLNADEGDESDRRQHLPQYYEPEPFLMPDPTVAGSEHDTEGRPLSTHYSDRPSSRSGTPDIASTSGATRKTAPRPYRAVNIIQHDDAGPSDKPEPEAPETIELPPAYTNIRQ
ncbi:hypothetical protein AAF712_005437 [Marasmius tenuissimus]|uniref:Uncharacterized protein n=1 Tax=Marasmius tenuissimus TaxID=585030 RepID=A0ABR3A1K3_9AGAR